MNETDWLPTASAGVLRQRAGMLARARRHFSDRGVLEVDTPAVSAATVSDPHLDSVPPNWADAAACTCKPRPNTP
jgi:lysyl-tRNA synthetase class 2